MNRLVLTHKLYAQNSLETAKWDSLCMRNSPISSRNMKLISYEIIQKFDRKKLAIQRLTKQRP